MSISYQPKDAAVQGQQLKWQTLILKKEDSQIVSDFQTATPDINVKQNVDTYAGNSPLCFKLSAGAEPIMATSVSVLGSVITPTFAAAPGANDAIMIHFVIAE